MLKTTFSTLTPNKFAAFLAKYKIPASLNPQIPSTDKTADDPPKGMVALYTKSFSIGNVRIPFTPFYLDVLSHFECHIMQMHPLGSVRITNFEILCNAFGKKASVALFRMFYKLYPAGEWFTIERKGNVAPPLVKSRISLKNWKNRFFWVSDSVIPKGYMDSLLVWKPKGSPIVDEFPDEGMYDVEFYRVLYDCRIVIRDHPEGILVLANMSNNLDYVPAIYNNNKEISLMEYLIEEDHSNVKVSKKRKETGEFGTGNAEDEGLEEKKMKKRVCDASSKKSKASEMLIPVEKEVENVANIESVSGMGNKEIEETLQKKRKKHVCDIPSKFLDAEIPVETTMAQFAAHDSQSDEEDIDLDDAFGDLDNRDVITTPGRAQKIAMITNLELANKLEEIGGESLCFVSEGASRIRKLANDVCLYRQRLRKMAAKDAAATIEQQANTIGELTKLLTTSMENARQKLEGESLEKLKEKEIESLKQKLVADDDTKDKEIAYLKEQLVDATERENKLIKTQEALKKQNAQYVRSKEAALSSRRLVLSQVVPHVVKTLHHSHEFKAPLYKVKKLAVQLGRQQLIQEIEEDMEGGYDGTINGKFEEACKELQEADFPYIKEIAENTGRTVDDILKIKPKGPRSTLSETNF